MRFSQLFGRTLRQAPGDAETPSHQLILRAALARQVSAGVYSFLPLGFRAFQKITTIIRDEMNRAGGQEILMPVINPADLWKESGRWYAIGDDLWRTKDRNERDFVLAMTNEEVVTDLTRREVRSYRQLPYVLYQIQTKVRDEPRPRGGLVRLREFTMKDAYSFHPDPASLDAYFPTMYQAYVNVFRRCGLDAVPVLADPGLIGGTGSYEFIMLSDVGEDTIIRCGTCGYAANREIAVAGPSSVDDAIASAAPPVEKVFTPQVKTIDDLEAFFNLPPDAFLKTVVYSVEGKLVAAVVRGDTDVNEPKIKRVLQTPDLRLANEAELAAGGIVAGFVSPVGLQSATIIVDRAVPERSYVAGANEKDYHLKNVLPGRDFPLTSVADVSIVQPGQPCPQCGGPLEAQRGLELGHLFKLGTKYSAPMGANYLGPDGHEAPIVMGCYGIGVDRLLSAVVESNHDDWGIVWPASIAPYRIMLIGLNLDTPAVAEAANQLYQSLLAQGEEVLFDDRSETPGVKFADADLLGFPLRLTVSQRTMRQNAVELTPRRTRQSEIVPLDQARQRVKEFNN